MVHDLSVADASDPLSLQSSSLQSSSLEANAPRDYQERHTVVMGVEKGAS